MTDLYKGCKYAVRIEEILEDIIVVLLINGGTHYRGVLLNEDKG